MFKNLKGFFGELRVRFYLFFSLAFGYKRLHNVTIGFSDGGSSQIDHIVICKKGIFVIETKNYSGLIKANPNANYWTQNIGRQEYKFYSPIKQNEGHLSALRYLLKSKKYPMHNKVVFVGSAKFSGYKPNNVTTSIKQLVLDIKNTKGTPLTSREVVDIYHKIKSKKLPNNWFTRRRHLKYVRSRKFEDKITKTNR